MAIDPNDIEVTFFRSGGPGGQHRNVTETAVRVHHIPTGITVVAKGERSQTRNREEAIAELEKRLAALNRKRKRRRATRPTKGSVERRLDSKKRRSSVKSARGKISDD
ncbi:MAG: hypothetical protein AMXMBFR84_06380 [Candidatus Hydrogenedentota bacterium]